MRYIFQPITPSWFIKSDYDLSAGYQMLVSISQHPRSVSVGVQLSPECTYSTTYNRYLGKYLVPQLLPFPITYYLDHSLLSHSFPRAFKDHTAGGTPGNPPVPPPPPTIELPSCQLKSVITRPLTASGVLHSALIPEYIKSPCPLHPGVHTCKGQAGHVSQSLLAGIPGASRWNSFSLLCNTPSTILRYNSMRPEKIYGKGDGHGSEIER
jgi:hypothetical protein